MQLAYRGGPVAAKRLGSVRTIGEVRPGTGLLVPHRLSTKLAGGTLRRRAAAAASPAPPRPAPPTRQPPPECSSDRVFRWHGPVPAIRPRDRARAVRSPAPRSPRSLRAASRPASPGAAPRSSACTARRSRLSQQPHDVAPSSPRILRLSRSSAQDPAGFLVDAVGLLIPQPRRRPVR